jgi:beta-lactamase regulating signal transducer with metallopeptidase domain
MTEPAAAGTLGLVAGYLLKTTVILTLALLVAAAAKRRPATFRHFVLSSALIGLLLLPLISLLPVGWESPLVPAWMAASARPTEAGAAASGSGRALDAPFFSERTDGRPSPSFSLSALELRSADRPSPLLSNAPASVSPAGPNVLDSLVVALWSAGMAILILRLAFGLAGAVKLTVKGTPLGGPVWSVLLERFLAIVPLRRKVRFKSHPEVHVPLTWGWRRPVVLFPAGADGWTDEERSSALFHELSHVKRADFAVMMLVRTGLALFWWNPLCWIVYRWLLKEQEIACDELVLRAGIKPSTYAASLLAFRRSAGFRWNPSAALLGLLGRSSFQERLAAILKQKLIYMEVKMKTKIMLALALVLAVALIGTARPAVGVEKSGKTTLVETALAGPGSLDIAPPATGAQQAQTEKAVQEKEKAKAAEKKIVVTAKEGGKVPIEITITEGDTVKKLVLENSLTITKGKDGDVLIITPEGKEPLVLKGEPLRLEIKGGELRVLKEGKALKIDEGMDIGIAKEIGEEGKTIVYYVTPKEKAGAEGRTFKVVKEGEAGKDAVKVIVETRKEGEPGTAWKIVEPGKGEIVFTKRFSEKPAGGAWVGEGGKAFAFTTKMRDEEMLEKVRDLQKQVEAIKAKKMDLSALEESLKKLEAELQAKEEKLKELELDIDKEPGELSVIKEIDSDKAEGKADVWVMEKSKAAKEAKAKAMIRISDKEGEISLMFTGQEGEAGKAVFERAIASLKKDLPEGYKLAEQNYDAEKGTMTFKIATPEGKKPDETLVRKLVDIVKEEIDKK